MPGADANHPEKEEFMKTALVSVIAVSALLAFVVAPLAMAHPPGQSTEPPHGNANKDAQTACMDMMHGAQMTEGGTRAMREFMQSPKAPQAMNNMMQMARRMGNGDPMLGMTKMMEMMGGQGGMMGGSGSVDQGGMMGDRSGGTK
jgi:hypothetical protein